MQLTTTDILNAEPPAGKVLIELIQTEDNITKLDGIYVPLSNNRKQDGIIRKIGNQLDDTYYNLNLEKRVPFNLKVGDYVYLNFISNFYRLCVEGKTYVIINPSTIIGKYNKAYYANEVLNK